MHTENADMEPERSAAAKMEETLRAATANWNAVLSKYKQRSAWVLGHGAAPAQMGLGELIAVDVGLGMPPHDGLTPVRRLLALSVRASLDELESSHPEYEPAHAVGATGNLDRLALVFGGVLRVGASSLRSRVGAVVGLAALVHIRDVEGPAPRPGALQVGPRMALERASEADRVPRSVMRFTRDVLADALASADLVRLGREALDATTREPTEPAANTEEARTLAALRRANGGFVPGLRAGIIGRLRERGHEIQSAQAASRAGETIPDDAKGYRLLASP